MQALVRKTGLLVTGTAAAIGLGIGVAQATPPTASPQPGGVIRVDTAPGELWDCQALSLVPPYYQLAPGFYQFTPGPFFFRLPPGTDAWVECSGNAAPFVWYGPVVKAGA